MNRIIGILLCILMASSTVFAQNQPGVNAGGTLKDSAVAQMFDYGVALYDRRDMNEASSVFSHILEINPAFTPAQDYLKRMGEYAPVVMPCCETPVVAVNVDPSDPNADLKKQMAEEDQAISGLEHELTNIRTQIPQVSNE